MDIDPAASSKSPPRSIVLEPVPKRTRVSDPVEDDEEQDFRAWEERPDPPTQVLANDGRLPKGVHLILLGGIPGAGVKTASALLRAALESYGATVGVVDDEHFHALAPPCVVCEANMKKVNTKPSYCFTCPASLESEALFPAIAAEVRIISSSDAFEKHPLGFVIVQGRSVCGSAPSVELSDGLVFYLVQENRTFLIVRHLTSLGRWDLRPTDSKPIVATRVEEVCALEDHRLWSQYEHFRVLTSNSGAAPQGLFSSV